MVSMKSEVESLEKVRREVVGLGSLLFFLAIVVVVAVIVSIVEGSVGSRKRVLTLPLSVAEQVGLLVPDNGERHLTFSLAFSTGAEHDES